MGLHKQKKNPSCNTEYMAPPKDVNNTGYNEAPAKYMANPEKGFWASIKKLFNKKEK